MDDPHILIWLRACTGLTQLVIFGVTLRRFARVAVTDGLIPGKIALDEVPACRVTLLI